MAQFPVSDNQGIQDGLNYVLSGPTGQGQNFAGFSSYAEGYLTGNFRVPFTQTSPVDLYVAGISLSNAQQLDDRTIKYTFTSAQPTPPFALGNGLYVTGITPTNWNSADLKNAGYSIYTIGVVECTTTYVIVRTVAAISGTLPAYISGGTISYSSMAVSNSTDCDVRIVVAGGQDQVVLSAQLNQAISYTATGTADMTVYVDINRYLGSPNDDPVNPEFVFGDQTLITEKAYTYTGLTGTGALSLLETIFVSVVDTPPPGFYRYIVEVYFEDTSSAGNSIEVTEDLLTLRSLSAQVIKP